MWSVEIADKLRGLQAGGQTKLAETGSPFRTFPPWSVDCA
jgi:hypothetical protein